MLQDNFFQLKQAVGSLEGILNNKNVAQEMKLLKPLFSFLLLWAHIFKSCHLVLLAVLLPTNFKQLLSALPLVSKGNFGICFFMHQTSKCNTTRCFWQCVWCIVSTSSKLRYLSLGEGTDHLFCTIASMFSVLGNLHKLKVN